MRTSNDSNARLGVWAVLLGLAGLLTSTTADAADRIILRNLEVINDRTVRSFSEDGIVLDDQRVLTWDEVEKATLAARQDEFDALLKDLGEPLYRLRQRLAVGDYQGLLNQAEALFPRYAARRSKTAYRVFQALMWGRLDAGRREAALEPYLLAVECLRRLPADMQTDLLPGDRRLRWDPTTGLSEELPPVWFDQAAAREVLPRVGRVIGAMQRPWPEGVRIYYASLALAAGDRTRAEGALAELDRTQPQMAQLADVLEVGWEVHSGQPGPATEQLRQAWSSYSGLSRVVALYWLGRSGATAEDAAQRQDALLLLLRLPASYGQQFPELAAAGLYHAAHVLEQSGDAAGSSAVRSELLSKYSPTYFAARGRAEAPPAAPSAP